MKVITKAEFENALSAGKPVVIDFFAEWCGPCKMLSPVLEEVAQANPDVSFYKVDIDQETGLAAQYGIMSVPTVMLFKDGRQAAKFVGARPKEDVQAFLDENR